MWCIVHHDPVTSGRSLIDVAHMSVDLDNRRSEVDDDSWWNLYHLAAARDPTDEDPGTKSLSISSSFPSFRRLLLKQPSSFGHRLHISSPGLNYVCVSKR